MSYNPIIWDAILASQAVIGKEAMTQALEAYAASCDGKVAQHWDYYRLFPGLSYKFVPNPVSQY